MSTDSRHSSVLTESEQAYRAALDWLDVRAGKSLSRMPALGYTSNLDVLLKWDEARFNRLIERWMAAGLGEKMDALLDKMRHLMQAGGGSELLEPCMEAEQILLDELEATPALGGTGTQAAAALGALNVECVLHLSDRSPQVCRQLDYPSLRTAVSGQLTGCAEVALKMQPYTHLIIQYPAGAHVRFGAEEIVTPAHNRIILDQGPEKEHLRLEPRFAAWCEANERRLSSYVLTGYNSPLVPQEMDAFVADTLAHVRRLRALGTDAILYHEDASYAQGAARRWETHRRLLPLVDVMGCNEDELGEFAQWQNRRLDADDPASVTALLDHLLQLYAPLRGVVLHTARYALYYGAPLPGDMRRGLSMGNLMAASRARTGRYPNRTDLSDTLSCPLNPQGVAFCAQLTALSTAHPVCAVPGRSIQPICTIGLGDTFIGGVQTGFI